MSADATFQTSIESGGKNFGPIGNMGDNFTQNIHIREHDSVLTSLPLDDIQAPGTCQPSNLDNLVSALIERRFIILGAPRRWGLRRVARHVAARVLERADDQDPQAYELTRDISAEALLDAIKNPSKRQNLSGSVILADDVPTDPYSRKREALRLAAIERSVYVILTTHDQGNAWDIQGDGRYSEFFWLPDHTPYAIDDLVQCLIRELDEGALQSNLLELDILPDSNVTAATQLAALDMSVQDIARELNAVGKIDAFVARLRGIKNKAETETCFEEAKREDKPNLKKWFDGLEMEERYLVLTLSLVDDLSQETFWAIYELVTEKAWRQRNQQLTMSDYHNIQARLVDYIDAQGDQIRFHTARDRANLMDYALASHRRSLVQALPPLSEILIRTYQSNPVRGHTIAARLRELAIFGSGLDALGETLPAQSRLHHSLTTGIAQIALRELKTAEDLLIAWGKAGSRTDSVVDVVPSPDEWRIVVSRLLLQMYQIERDQAAKTTSWPDQYRAFTLLYRWYQQHYAAYAQASTFAPHQVAQIDENIQRFACVIAYALGSISRYMDDDVFQRTDDPYKWLDAPPNEQPVPEMLTSPWDLMVALAWNPDPEVRASVVFGLSSLADRRPYNAHRLLMLLAGDWDHQVLVTVAFYLASLYQQDHNQLSQIFSLLSSKNRPKPHRSRSNPAYLSRTATIRENSSFTPHQWAATLALCLIGWIETGEDSDELPVFDLYLNAWLPNPDTSQFKAFQNVLPFLMASGSEIDFSSLLKHIQASKAADWNPANKNENPPSAAAAELIKLQEKSKTQLAYAQ